MKNYHMDLVRVTEAAAIAAAEWVGRGDKESADKAATDAMRDRLNKIDFGAVIAIGEGKKDNSYGLFADEYVGQGIAYLMGGIDSRSASYEISLDPIEGTTPTAKGGSEAVSVIAMADRGGFFKTECFYMEKLVAGPPEVYKIDLRKEIERTVSEFANAAGKSITHTTVCMLDRPRHSDAIKRLRSLGCRLKLISDCDVTAGLATCFEECGVDLYYGIGGSPEGVITAAAMKCLGGQMEARLVDNDFNPIDCGRIYTMHDLAAGNVMFCATGITDGTLLKGVKFHHKRKITHSLAMRSESGTIRRITTEHGN